MQQSVRGKAVWEAPLTKTDPVSDLAVESCSSLQKQTKQADGQAGRLCLKPAQVTTLGKLLRGEHLVHFQRLMPYQHTGLLTRLGTWRACWTWHLLCTTGKVAWPLCSCLSAQGYHPMAGADFTDHEMNRVYGEHLGMPGTQRVSTLAPSSFKALAVHVGGRVTPLGGSTF